MSSAYGKIDRPKEYNPSKLESLLPIESSTKSNQTVSIHSLSTVQLQLSDPSRLKSYLRTLLNIEIEAGNTYPQKFLLDESQFENYFLSGEVFIVLNGGKNVSKDLDNNLEENLLGTFYVKPNFPGRCSHVIQSFISLWKTSPILIQICNAGFITAPAHRNQGIGKIMASAYLQIAPLLGYKASMFNLVFANNVARVRIWRSLGFQEIGRIPNAGLLIKDKKTNNEVEEEYVDAIMFYYSFTQWVFEVTIIARKRMCHEEKFCRVQQIHVSIKYPSKKSYKKRVLIANIYIRIFVIVKKRFISSLSYQCCFFFLFFYIFISSQFLSFLTFEN